MKKKGLIIASVMILVMSVLFMGCPPEEDDPAALSDGAKSALSALGFTKTVPVPAGTKFSGFGTATKKVALAWEDGNQSRFTAYAKALGARAVTSTDSQTFDFDDDFSGYVYLADESGGTEIGNLTVKANAIVLIITKDK